MELQGLNLPYGEDTKHPLARLPTHSGEGRVRRMHFRRKSLTVPPPEADLGVPQLGLSEHGIEVVRGHLGPVLLHLSEVEGDSTPCPPQAGDLKHLAIIPQRQLREPWLNRALAVKEKAKLFKIRDTCFNQRVHYDWVKAEVRAQRLQRVLNPRGLPRH